MSFDPETLKQVGKYLLAGHQLSNIAQDGGRIVSAQEIETFLKGEMPDDIYDPPVSPQELATKTPVSSEELKDVFGRLDKLRGYRPPKRSAEAKAIQKMLKWYSPDEIIDTWNKLKKDNFWKDKELFMMSVENQIGAMIIKPDKFANDRYSHLFKR